MLIHALVGGRLGCFCVLSIVNSAALNMVVQISLRDPAFNSFEYIPSSGIAGSYDNSIFNFIEEPPYFFFSGHTVLHSHPQCIGF